MAASTTVGMPMANTGTPNVSWSRAARWFPTPEPGVMPVSLSCTVAHTRPTRREARASTAMTRAGCTSATSPRTASADSTPVVPRTPVRCTATGRNPAKCQGCAVMRCRVTRTLSAARGPTASGVMARLPRPMTSTGPVSGSSSFSCPPTARTARSKKSAFRCQKVVRSMVR